MYHSDKKPLVEWMYGIHTVYHALTNDKRQWQELRCLQAPFDELVLKIPTLKSQLKKITIVDKNALNRMLPAGAVHQGIALLASPLPTLDVNDLDPFANGRSCVILMDQITDPQNLGNILRTSAAFGVQALIVPERHAPPLSAVALKTASGGAEYVPIIRINNLSQTMMILKKMGFWLVGLAEQATISLTTIKLDMPVAFVMGSEGQGMRQGTRQHCDLLAQLPTQSHFPTLNVATATSLALYQWICHNPPMHQHEIEQ